MKKDSNMIERLDEGLAPYRDEEKARQMSAYMRNQYPFLGIQTPVRRSVTKPLFKASTLDWDFVEALYDKPEREYQVIAVDYLAHHASSLGPEDLARLKRLIETKSWWDTVDAIASSLVGSIVRRHPETLSVMDAWIEDENLWVRRTAILHQLSFKGETDETRLFTYCRRCANEREFFIAKAIGWALRQYARTAPDRVMRFLEETKLQALSVREASKHLEMKEKMGDFE